MVSGDGTDQIPRLNIGLTAANNERMSERTYQVSDPVTNTKAWNWIWKRNGFGRGEGSMRIICSIITIQSCLRERV